MLIAREICLHVCKCISLKINKKYFYCEPKKVLSRVGKRIFFQKSRKVLTKSGKTGKEHQHVFA